jgi:hypothetical protein
VRLRICLGWMTKRRRVERTYQIDGSLYPAHRLLISQPYSSNNSKPSVERALIADFTTLSLMWNPCSRKNLATSKLFSCNAVSNAGSRAVNGSLTPFLGFGCGESFQAFRICVTKVKSPAALAVMRLGKISPCSDSAEISRAAMFKVFSV